MHKKIDEIDNETWLKVNSVNRDLVDDFLQQGHLSPQTLKQYASALRIFFFWVMTECGNKEMYKLKPRDALRYQNWLINLGLSSSAIKMKRASVSSLCGFVEMYYSDEEEYKNFRNIYNKKIPNVSKSLVREKQPLSKDELDTLISALEDRGEYQMIAYIKFSYSAGCRRAETRQLLKEVVTYEKVKDKSYYLTHNIRGKGKGREGKVRKLVFDDTAMDAINKWLEVRGQDDCPYVFAVKDKNGVYRQVSINTFNYWCSKIFSNILQKRVHPHQLRMTRATHLVALEGKDIKVAQSLLSHESAETTSLYVITESDDVVDEAF